MCKEKKERKIEKKGKKYIYLWERKEEKEWRGVARKIWDGWIKRKEK
jgi:hypothetical protein